MNKYVELYCLFVYALCHIVRGHYDPFSDSVHFSVNFPGPGHSHLGSHYDNADRDLTEDDSVVVVTQDNEKYECVIPHLLKARTKEENIKAYVGPSEDVLLTPLFEQSSCSYKIEPYWTYELCHRRFLRQYHEEKDVGKDLKVQEYYLGNYRRKGEKSDSNTADPETETSENEEEMQTILIGGQATPYYEVNLTDGTPCDLTQHPRQTSVKYICHDLGRGEIYDLKEISTCQYEVIILTQLLCTHPRYQPHKDPINKINCHSIEGAPQQPASLVTFELEAAQGRHKRKEEYMNKDTTKQQAVDLKISSTSSTTQKVKPRSSGTRSDKQLLKDFLSGDYCIQGGTGWWKHELCYGKSVTQFHEERSGKTVINLGYWDMDQHVDWIEAHPTKQPAQLSKDKKVIHHYYGGGDTCDVTKKPRFVEVKLRCKENPTHPNSIALFLVEAKPCEYSLVVESQILCPILTQADETGLITDPVV